MNPEEANANPHDTGEGGAEEVDEDGDHENVVDREDHGHVHEDGVQRVEDLGVLQDEAAGDPAVGVGDTVNAGKKNRDEDNDSHREEQDSGHNLEGPGVLYTFVEQGVLLVVDHVAAAAEESFLLFQVFELLFLLSGHFLAPNVFGLEGPLLLAGRVQIFVCLNFLL